MAAFPKMTLTNVGQALQTNDRPNNISVYNWKQ